METQAGLILPNFIKEFDARDTRPDDKVMVVNETGLPDSVVLEATRDSFVDNAEMAWGNGTMFQNYTHQGSNLARADYRVPGNTIEEIILARDLAERDDDIASAIGWCLAAAFECEPEVLHRDDKTVGLFDAVNGDMRLLQVFKEFYREYLISGQINSLSLFTRKTLEYQPFSEAEMQEESLAVPLCGVLPAENVRVIGNDMVGTGTLAYQPDSEYLRRWLMEYFDKNTTAARKAEMGRNDRVSAAMFVGVSEIDMYDMSAPDWMMEPNFAAGNYLYLLNPLLVHRTTMPKGNWRYPRPPLVRNFALLEAKRLLNIMDYALLQGGSNYIIIAKKGSDDRPAQQEEIDNLTSMVSRASKSGVIVGDHRLSFDILTPKLDELLNPAKRKLIGRKLVMALLRTPEHATEDGGNQNALTDAEIQARVIAADRNDIREHVENNIYAAVRRRNRDVFKKGTPRLGFQKIILQGTQYFTDYILKLRDRGDIPRKWGVQAAGFDFEAGIAQRKREQDQGVDELMTPGAVPHSSPEAGPQDNNPGRPQGSRTGQGQDPAAPRRTIGRNPGETVKASYEPELDGGTVVRAGEITAAILEEYADYEVGRLKKVEREAIDSGEAYRNASVALVPVNVAYEVTNLRAVNLTEGLRMVVGERESDRGIVAKLLSFREPEFTTEDAELRVARWGFPLPEIDEGDEE